MNAAAAFLRGFLDDHRLEKKYLIIPSYQAGRQVGESLAARGTSWVNLHYQTLPALAQEVAGAEVLSRGLRLISGQGALFLVEGVYRALREEGKLEYLGRIEPGAGIVRALRASIAALRMAGIRGAGISPASFISESKGREIALILKRYERALQERKVIDLAGLFEIALGQLDRLKEADSAARESEFYLVFGVGPLGFLEREFLKKAAGENLVLVPRDPVYGLAGPRRLDKIRQPVPDGDRGGAGRGPATVSNTGRLSWLFAPKEASPPLLDPSLEVRSAVGPANELRAILRRVIAENVPLDDVEIVHPPGAAYPSIMHALAAKNGLPVTYAEGIPLAFASPGKVFAGLADWLEHDFLVTDVCALIEAGAFRLPFSPLKASRYLKSAMIGWGKERYISRLESVIEGLEESAEAAVESDEKDGPSAGERYAKRIEEVRSLTAFISELLENFPAETRPPASSRTDDDAATAPGDETGAGPAPSVAPERDAGKRQVDFAALCRGVAAVLGKLTNIADENDAEAQALLLSRLEEAAAFETGPLERRAAFDWLRTIADGLCVGASGPRPGHLHLASWRAGGFSGRPETFVVGLDQGAVPGVGLPDPVLLDEERARLSPELETSSDALRERLWAIAELLAGLRGKVALSYSSYDIIEERPAFPSSLILQAVRLNEGDPSLDYSALARFIPPAPGFLPEDGDARAALDEVDWWLAKLAPGGTLRDGLDSVKQRFVSLGRGIFAARRRAKPIVSAYEGKVKLGPGEADPLSNEDIVMSASRLEQLARCPFGYFLQYVLDVRQPEELELDTSRWLDPLQRGTLLHDIYAEFLRKLREDASKKGTGRAPGRIAVDPERHGALIRAIGEKTVARFRQEIPPPTEGIFERERREIMAELDVFLKAEAGRETPVEPLLFEVSFGRRRPAPRSGGRDTGEGIDDLVRVSCGAAGSFRLAGRIDRIDRVGRGRYRVVDYKTGNYKSYDSLVNFGRGELLQPALYAIAAEQILKRLGIDESPAVVESGYYFPTRRGEGKEIMIKDIDRQGLGKLLVDLMATLREGRFVVNPAASCGFCPYAPVCDATGALERAKEKKSTDPESFDLFEKLKEYD
jgi:RecB family exonuclease